MVCQGKPNEPNPGIAFCRAGLNFKIFMCTQMFVFVSFIPVNPDYFIDCLRVFDRKCNGLVNAAELRHVLCSLGDKLTDEEVDQVLTGFEDNQGQVLYEELVKHVMSE